MDSVKSRILAFIHYKGIKMKEFEAMADLSSGYVTSMRKGFGERKLNNVLIAFPELNRDWLLFGEGKMLKPTAVQRVEGNSGVATQIAGDSTVKGDVTQTTNNYAGSSAQAVDNMGKALDQLGEYQRLLSASEEELKGLREGLPPYRKIVGDEVTAVPEDAYMMVEYADLRASAGVLGGNVVDMLPDTHRRLVPREYEKGYYLVVRVSGDSMNDGTDRSLSDGDEVLVKQVHYDNVNGLPIRNSLFVITSKEGNVLKQIVEYNAKEGYMVCRSFNERYKDFRIELEDVFQIFQVCKVVSKQIRI